MSLTHDECCEVVLLWPDEEDVVNIQYVYDCIVGSTCVLEESRLGDCVLDGSR